MPVTVIRWNRPYEDPVRVAIAVVAVFGSCFFAFGLTIMVVQWRQASVASVAGFTGFATLWLTFSWRWQRTALLVSASGVRVRWLLLTRTFTWSQIVGFETADDHMASARLWIVLADGDWVRTPVQLVERRFATTVRRYSAAF